MLGFQPPNDTGTLQTLASHVMSVCLYLHTGTLVSELTNTGWPINFREAKPSAAQLHGRDHQSQLCASSKVGPSALSRSKKPSCPLIIDHTAHMRHTALVYLSIGSDKRGQVWKDKVCPATEPAQLGDCCLLLRILVAHDRGWSFHSLQNRVGHAASHHLLLQILL